MTREQKKINQDISQKCRILMILSLGLVFSLSLVKMVFTNRASSWGNNLEQVKKQTYQVQKQNLHLKSQLARETGGLSELAKLAEDQGFTDKPNYQYFSSGKPLAQVLP